MILLHGLSRTKSSMNKIENTLVDNGYQVINEGYPSRSATVQELADEALPHAMNQCNERDNISYVTHSLGGILVRDFYARRTSLVRPVAVVMLGPPNQGSEIIDNPNYDRLGSWWNGPAGDQVSAKPDSYVNQLPPVNYPVGVIAGNESLNPFYSEMLPGADDGKVSVVRTRVDGMADWIVMPVTHSFMMRNEAVINQVINFLSSGHFKK